jgi:hypothetical protein
VFGPQDRCQPGKRFGDEDLFPLVLQMKKVEWLDLVLPANGSEDLSTIGERTGAAPP